MDGSTTVSFGVRVDLGQNASLIAQDQHGRKNECRNIAKRAPDQFDFEARAAGRAIEQGKGQPPLLDWKTEQQRLARDDAAMKGGEINEGIGKRVRFFRNVRRAYAYRKTAHQFCWKPGRSASRSNGSFISTPCAGTSGAMANAAVGDGAMVQCQRSLNVAAG